LRNQHAVEHQSRSRLLTALALENYPEVAERMRLHRAESKIQARRLEERPDGFGMVASGFKDTIASIMGNMAALARPRAGRGDHEHVLPTSLSSITRLRPISRC
jgi:ferritin-like metal-binding protein YciE